MKTANFNDTVDILVKAYLNDTLKHGSCEACAVGNICHAAGFPQYGNLEFVDMPPDSCGNWKALFVTSRFDKIQANRKKRVGNWIDDPEWVLVAEKMIAKTGYTEDELAKIEYVFECAPKGNNDDEWILNGLMAVVDVLADIHGISLEAKTEAKAMFVKETL